MFSNTQKFITTFSLFLLLIHICNPSIDPTIAACIDGEIDTAVMTEDGSTYIFMNTWFWKLDENLDRVVGNVSEIPDKWANLPTNIETSFYISSDKNRLKGKTFFIKKNKWFQFNNQLFEEMGDTNNWTNFEGEEDVLAISQYKDPIIVFYKKHTSDDPKAYFFDNPYFPETKSISESIVPFDVYETEAFVSYPDGRYLIFFDDEKVGANCIMKNSRSGCETNRLNREFFVCPDYTQDLYEKNLFIMIWYWSGLGLKQFGILIFGLFLSLSFILLFILIILGIRVNKLYKRKCRRKHKKSKK